MGEPDEEEEEGPSTCGILEVLEEGPSTWGMRPLALVPFVPCFAAPLVLAVGGAPWKVITWPPGLGGGTPGPGICGPGKDGIPYPAGTGGPLSTYRESTGSVLI